VPDLRSRRYALNLSRGRSTNAPEKTMRAFRKLLLVVSLVLSPLSDDDLITN
jgi:hypothetical protein